VSLAERLEALARDARDVSEEDAEIACAMARRVRGEAEAGAAEAARRAAMEARIEAREAEAERARASAREAEAARDAESERRTTASVAGARTQPGADAVSSATTRRRRAATAAAASLPTLFDLESLDDSLACLVLRQMGDYELASTMCASRRFRALASADDALWGCVQRKHRRWPRRPARGETWRSAFQRGVSVDAAWRRARFDKKEHRVHSEYAQCVALRGDVFASGSADRTVAVSGLPPRSAEPAGSGADADAGAGADSERATLWEDEDRGEARERRACRVDVSNETARTRATTYRAYSRRGWERVLGRGFGHGDAVTCCRFAGGGGEDGAPPAALFSGDALGEMRVWDLRHAPFDPWEIAEDPREDDARVSDAHRRSHEIPCVSVKRLTSPSNGKPHAQFFDVRDDGGGGLRAACGSDLAGAGVHVYDCSRLGTATRRFDVPTAGVYGIAWGGGASDADVVHAACDDGAIRRWDVREGSGKPCDESARVPESFSSTETSLATTASSRNANGDAVFGDRPVRRASAARCVAADGGLFAFGSARGTVHVRDARRPGTPLCAASEARRWHDDCVNSVAFDAKLRRVVTGGDDGYVRWRRVPLSDTGASSLDRAGGTDRVAAVPPALATGVGALAVAFDHSRVVVGCVDTTVRAYDAVTGDDFVDGDALRAAWRNVCLRARDAGNLLDRPAARARGRAENPGWGNRRS
jgi:WD40 repeat protein